MIDTHLFDGMAVLITKSNIKALRLINRGGRLRKVILESDNYFMIRNGSLDVDILSAEEFYRSYEFAENPSSHFLVPFVGK